MVLSFLSVTLGSVKTAQKVSKGHWVANTVTEADIRHPSDKRFGLRSPAHIREIHIAREFIGFCRSERSEWELTQSVQSQGHTSPGEHPHHAALLPSFSEGSFNLPTAFPSALICHLTPATASTRLSWAKGLRRCWGQEFMPICHCHSSSLERNSPHFQSERHFNFSNVTVLL